jgi:hypothetical protein
LAFLFLPTLAFAQAGRNPCYYTPTNAPSSTSSTTNSGCVPVAVTNPLPVGPSANTTGGATYQNITTSATTLVKTGAGTLYGVFINTKGASSNTATVYDSLTGSGTKIGTIDTTATTGPFLNSENGVAFSTGLTVVTATGTQADITISYK